MIVEVGNKKYFMEPRLVRTLTRIKKKVHTQDTDMVMVIDGAEGSGKSVFGMQIGKFLYPELSLNNIHMNAESFRQGINKSNKFECHIFDEAYTGLSSRQSLSSINKILVSKMMEMRQKNLFIMMSG